jgi:hypothetical protein
MLLQLTQSRDRDSTVARASLHWFLKDAFFQYYSIGWHGELEMVSTEAVMAELRLYSAISLGGIRKK